MIALILFTFLALARAAPQVLLYPLPYLQPVTATQFHSQDELGQFNFGYAGDNQLRVESRLLDGSVRGSYSYVDPNSKLVHVTYVADADGFRVVGGNNLPTVPLVPEPLDAPVPVDYTPEVAAARAEFEKIYNELAAKAAEVPDEPDAAETKERRRRSVLLPALYTIAPAAVKLKVSEGREVKDVISPANTKPVEYSEIQKSVPLGPLVVAPASFPYTAPYYTYLYTV